MKPSVLLVAHDAGGAEILSAWQAEQGYGLSLAHCLAGPAQRIFERDHGPLSLVGLDAVDSLPPDGLVLTATSLEADLERRALARARYLGRRSATFLDHWDLYRERFGSPDTWRQALPNEVWVGDNYALDLALRLGFPPKLLRLTPNPIFVRLRRMGTSAPPPGRLRVLYLCEPISRKLRETFGPDAAAYDDECIIMDHFLTCMQRHAGKLSHVTLRLHPSERSDKYDAIVCRPRGSLDVRYSDEPVLAQDILRHSLIVGMESAALVVGVLLGRPVYSCLTGKPWDISLPHREITRLCNFEKLFTE